MEAGAPRRAAKGFDREAFNVNDRHDNAETPPLSVQRVIADLESVDKKLALASGNAGGIAEIEDARALLRTAIGALARSTVAAGTQGKQRVKIKAESEVTEPNASARPGTSAKSTASSGKPATRGNRSQEGARSARRPETAQTPPTGSLIARLGAAAAKTSSPPADASPGSATDAAPQPGNARTSLGNTAERLAQLEAEIADLTEAVTGKPERTTTHEPRIAAKPASAPRLAAPAPTHARKADEAGMGDDHGDDEDAEIAIIGPDGTPAEPTANAARHALRVFREVPPHFEEEAEVEIRGSGAAPSDARTTEQAGAIRVSAPASASTGRVAPGKWRIFRGS
jgi:hypothetical protein